MTTVTLVGTPVVAGVGQGAVLVPGDRPALPTDEPARDDTPAVFASAAAVVADRLQERAGLASGSASEVLSATAALVQDRGLAALVGKHAAAGHGPASSTVKAVDELVAMFTAAGGVMAERVTDLRDVRDRVVAEILGQPEPGVGVPTRPSVLLADDLAPADTAGLDPALVVGIAVRLGGPTSHTAIIARQLGIPCVVGVVDLPDELPATALVDGGTGEVRWTVTHTETATLAGIGDMDGDGTADLLLDAVEEADGVRTSHLGGLSGPDGAERWRVAYRP